jgi:hypothetical protein
MNIVMINGYVLTKPLEVKSIQTEVVQGYANIKNKISFQLVEVVYGTELIKSGSRIVLRSDCFNQPWAKNRYHFLDQDLLMVPINEILGVTE